MKKSDPKPETAVKVTKTAAKKAVAKKVTTPAPPKPATKTAVKAPAKKAAPKAKKTTAPTMTTIMARVDVGFGNKLYLRGGGAGLSWDIGTLLTCLPSGDTWVITLENLTGPTAAKFILNDEFWSLGEDILLIPGQDNTFTPSF